MKLTLPQKLMTVDLQGPAITSIDNLSFFEKPSLDGKQAVKEISNEIPANEDELCYTASATLLGQEKTQLQGIMMKDAVHIAIGSFAKEQVSLSDVFEGVNELAGSHINFKQPRIAIDEISGMFMFSGFLNIDGPVLSLFKEYIKIEFNPYVEGIIDPKESDISKKIPVDNVTFATAGNFYAQLTPAITLSEGILMLMVEKNEDTKSWQVSPVVKGVFTFNNIAKKPVRMDGQISYRDGALHIAASAKKVEEIFGIENLDVDDFKVNFKSGDAKNLSVTAILKTPSQTYDLKGAISEGFIGLTAEVKEAFTFNDLTNIFRAKANYLAPDNNITFNNVSLTIASGNGKIGKDEVKKGIQIYADMTVHGHKCRAYAMLTRADIMFTGEITDTVTVGNLHFTKPYLELIYAGADSDKKSGLKIKGEIKYESLELNAGLSYKKVKDEWNAVVYADVSNPTFSISDIVPNAKNTAVDTVKFSKATIIYAQKAGKIDELPDEEVKKGFQLRAVVREFTPIQNMMGKNNEKDSNAKLDMKLELLLSTEHKSLHISLPESTTLHLGDQVVCKPFKIGVIFDPAPNLSVSFPVAIKPTPKDKPLELDFMLKVGVAEARASAQMTGYWINPFGVNGIKIGPVLAVELGINYAQFAATGSPSSLGITGGLELGNIKGNMALKGSSAGKDQILYGNIEELSPENLIKFVSQVSGQNIPLDSVPNFFVMEQLELYCVPLGGSIAGIIYEAGFSFKGNMKLFGKTIKIAARMNDSGLQIAGHIDALTLGPLELSGAAGKDAKVDLKLTTEKQSVFFDGRIRLFKEISAAAYLDISKDKAEFFFDYDFCNLMKYKVQGKSTGSFDKLGDLDFELTAKFENDICQYLKTEMVRMINEAKESANKSIDGLKKDLDDAEKAYKEELERRKRLKDDAAKDAEILKQKLKQALQDAEDALADTEENAGRQVAELKAKYDEVLNSANALLQSTRADYDKAWKDADNALGEARRIYYGAIDEAQAALNNAKNAYDNSSAYLRNKLNSAQYDVDQIDGECRHYDNLRTNCHWLNPEKQLYNTQYAACKIKKAAADTALDAARTALGWVDRTVEATTYFAANEALEKARHGGNAVVLRNAEIAYEKLRNGVESFDPYARAEAAFNAIKSGNQYELWQAAEKKYKETLQLARVAVDNARGELEKADLTEVVENFRKADAFLYEISNSTFSVSVSVAQAALSVAQSGVKVAASVSTFAAQNAGALVNIKKADLYAKLSELKKGKGFKCSMELDALGKNDIKWQFELDVDVDGYKKLATDMFDKLMDEAEGIFSLN